MSTMKMPWADEERTRMLFRLAKFATDQSGADGVIAVFVRGPQVILAWHLPLQLYPEMPQILRSARDTFVKQPSAILADDPGATSRLFEQVSEGSPEEISPGEAERILRKLPPLNREVLLLRCRETLSYEEIAEELELPVSSVKKYMRGALFTAALIRRGLEDESDKEEPDESGKEKTRMLFRLAKFIKDQSGADGVIAVFVQGHSRLAWHLPPQLHPQTPKILHSASGDAVVQLAMLANDPGTALPTDVREQINELVKNSRTD